MKDYYSLLGVEKNATNAEVKKNFYRLATQFHPDKNPDPDAASKFIVITEAYEVLSNKKLRAQYDLTRWQALKNAQSSNDSYTVVVPPTETTRTRRNRSQQKRAVKYHKTKSAVSNRFQLLMEGLHITSRYIIHVMGLALMSVILMSAVSQLYDFEMGVAIAVGIFLFCVFLAYCMFKTIQDIYTEIRIDMRLFSIYYKIDYSKASLITLSIFCFGSILFVAILQLY